jgi:hypothetical protein
MRISSIVFCIIFFFSANSFAQEKEEDVRVILKNALKFYEEGNVLSALTEMDRALEIIVKEAGKKIEKALPSGGEMWSAGETQTLRLGKGGISVVRTYTSKEKKDVKAKLTITYGSPLLPYINSLMQNEFFVERKDVLEVDGLRVLFIQLPEEKGYECYTIVQPGYLITLKGNTTKESIIKLIKSIDFSKLH